MPRAIRWIDVASSGSMNPDARPSDRQLCFQNWRRCPVVYGMTRGSSMQAESSERSSVAFAAASLAKRLEYT